MTKRPASLGVAEQLIRELESESNRFQEDSSRYWSDLSDGNTTAISMGFRAEARNAIILNESELTITPIEKVFD